MKLTSKEAYSHMINGGICVSGNMLYRISGPILELECGGFLEDWPRKIKWYASSNSPMQVLIMEWSTFEKLEEEPVKTSECYFDTPIDSYSKIYIDALEKRVETLEEKFEIRISDLRGAISNNGKRYEKIFRCLQSFKREFIKQFPGW